MWKIERAKIETWPHVGICMHGNRAARRKYVYFLICYEKSDTPILLAF
jgi:hypothetical protein